MKSHIQEAGLQRAAGVVMDKPYLFRLQLTEGDKGLLQRSGNLRIGADTKMDDKGLPVLHHRHETVLDTLVLQTLENKGNVIGRLYLLAADEVKEATLPVTTLDKALFTLVKGTQT